MSLSTKVAINLNGATYCTLAVLAGMRERRQGTVINVASKAGLMALTHSFNIEECAHGLRATALRPARHRREPSHSVNRPWR